MENVLSFREKSGVQCIHPAENFQVVLVGDLSSCILRSIPCDAILCKEELIDPKKAEMTMFGVCKIAAAVPKIHAADVTHNAAEIAKCYGQAAKRGAAAVVFPELSLTGFSCGDLFLQPVLQEAAEQAAKKLIRKTAGKSTVLVFGLPIVAGDALFDCAAVVQNGTLLGLVPRTVIGGDLHRIFSSASSALDREVEFADSLVPFGNNLIFRSGKDFSFCVEVGADSRAPMSVGSAAMLAGAHAVFALTAERERPGRAAERRILGASRSVFGAYIECGAGTGESTTDGVFAGHALLSFQGKLQRESWRFAEDSQLIFSDLDFQRIGASRMRSGDFGQCGAEKTFREISLFPIPESEDFADLNLSAHPFVPEEAEKLERCEEVLEILSTALAHRMESSFSKKLVIGISGGLDSTLALLVAVRCCAKRGRSAKDILAVTMPGFGTTDATYDNAVKLCKLLKTDFREIPIQKAARQHFADIGHNPAEHNSTYENTQARERTQILMDLANKMGGMVVGTGDLSEIALGWCTYNGDHMSMYAVNGSVPKSLIPSLIEVEAADGSPALKAVLQAVIDTPVSPELLPASKGKIVQKTEEILGAYELHDFFLYHFITGGASPEKLLALAKKAFARRYPEAELCRVLEIFTKRFFAQQFKRNCMPDGPVAGPVSLAGRNGFCMGSDLCGALWSLAER